MKADGDPASDFWRYAKEQWPTILLYLILSILILYRFQVYPSVVPNADALGYVEKGLGFRKEGFLADLGTLRTYGYPAIIYLYSFIAGLEPRSIALAAGIVQLTIYGLSVLWLGSRFYSLNITLAGAISIGLLLNPIIVALVGDVLTESISLIVVVLALAALINTGRARAFSGFVLWATFGAAVSSFSVMIRPVNLLVFLAWNCGVVVWVFFARRTSLQRTALVCCYICILIACAAAAWGPQYWYNLSLGYHTILPTTPLFDIQLKWGILLLKYATIVVDQHAEGLLFPNPWCVQSIADAHPLLWYLDHPLRGVVSIAGHLFGAFNFEYPFVYVYDLNPIYSVPTAGLMWLVIAIGLLHGTKSLRTYISSETFHAEHIAMAAMTVCLFLMVTALNGIITVENRYNMIPIAILSVLTVDFVLSHRTKIKAQGMPTVIFALCIAASGTVLSETIRSSAIKLSSNLESYPCIAPNVPKTARGT